MHGQNILRHTLWMDGFWKDCTDSNLIGFGTTRPIWSTYFSKSHNHEKIGLTWSEPTDLPKVFQHYLFKTQTQLLWSQREFASECQRLCYFIIWLPKQELPIIPYYHIIILLGIQSCFHEVETSYHLPLPATELGTFSKLPHSLRVSFLGRHNSKLQTILSYEWKKLQNIILSCIYSIKLLSASLFLDIFPLFQNLSAFLFLSES